jgi:[acyl-carrier-protein] S-malonyltransferase
MTMARPGLTDALAGVTIADPFCPVVSNHDGEPYAHGKGWAGRLVDHVTQPVRFRACLESLAAMAPAALVEIGHGSMIAGLAKRTIPEIGVVGLATPDDLALLA